MFEKYSLNYYLFLEGYTRSNLELGKIVHKPCLSLREVEKQIGYDLDSQMQPKSEMACVCLWLYTEVLEMLEWLEQKQ